MISDAQRSARNYIGGSTAAAVLGLSRWQTPLQIWGELTGNIVPDDISDELPVKLGNRLEEVVAELFTEKTGLKVRRCNETFFHPQHPFLGANIDRRVVGENSILECKTASGWKAKEWSGEEIPQEYVLQVMHYLAVTGYKRAHLAVLIGGNQDFKVKVIERDEAVIAEMVKKMTHFWRTYVEPKVMPMIIGSNDGGALFSLFPTEIVQEIEAGEDMDILIEQRAAMIADLKSVESNLDRVQNEIKARLKDAGSARTSRHLITWKAQTQKRIDTETLQAEAPAIFAKYAKEISMRVLRIKQIKEPQNERTSKTSG